MSKIFIHKALPFLCILVLTIITSVLTATLIPDKQNPISYFRPHIGQSNTYLDLRFELPENTAELNSKQYIAVKFPDNMILNLNTGPIKYSCELFYELPSSNQVSNNIPTKPIRVIATLPSASLINGTIETNTAYCFIPDHNNISTSISDVKQSITPFKAFTKLHLRLNFPNFLFNANLRIFSVSLFTCTSNNEERMILDSIYNIGSLAFYPDFTVSTIKPLQVFSSSFEVTEGSTIGTIRPYNTFKITLSFSCHSNFSSDDYNLVFQYPKEAIKRPNLINTTEINLVDPNKTRLNGNLSITDFNSDSILINGIKENFYPGREFKITTLGWSALNGNVGPSLSLNIILYHKNTYVVYSYFAVSIFQVNPTIITANINHPEYWDIYSNGAWPMRFEISFSDDINEDHYMVIRHSNLIDSRRRWNFIASTCDFSENTTAFENGFGRRNNCFPLRKDFLYPGYPNLGLDYLGSAIVMKLAPVKASIKMYLTVWGYADVCGTTYDPTAVPNTTAFEKFTYVITVHKFADFSKDNEDKIFFTGNQLIATSSTLLMGNRCWNTHVIGDTGYTNVGNRRGNFISGNPAGTDVMLMKEITDFVTLDSNNVSCTTCFLFDAWDNNLTSAGYVQNVNEKFIYSNSKKIADGSFFLIAALIPLPDNNFLSRHMATPRGGTSNPYEYIPGRIQFQFPRKWVLAGNDYRPFQPTSCYISWVAISDWTTKANNGGTSHLVSAAPIGGDQHFLRTDTMLDFTNTQLPPLVQFNTGTNTIYRIVSLYESANANGALNGSISSISFFKDPTKVPKVGAMDFGQFSVFTTCLRFNTQVQTKYLYEYFDFQVQWITSLNSGDLSPVTKVNRFIKLYMEGGVFQDYTTKKYDWSGGIPFITNHMALSSSTTDYSICLLELNGLALTNSSDTMTNSLLIFMKNSILIDSEITDSTSEYPVGPIMSNVKSYGLQSAYNISTDNQLSRDINSVVGNSTPNLLLDQLRQFYNTAPFLRYRSLYHNYLGSVIILTSISSNNVTTQNPTTKPNLLIPYICPIFQDTIGNTNRIALNTPTITVQWMQTTSFTAIERTSNIISDSGNTIAHSINIVGNISIQERLTTFTTVATKYNATLRFAQYSSGATNINNELYVYNGTNLAVGTTKDCSAQVLFLISNFEYETTLKYTGTGTSQTTFVTFTLQKFWVNNKLFNRAIFSTSGTSAAISPVYSFVGTAITPVPITSSYSFIGIKRPSIDIFTNYVNNSKFVDNAFLSSVDKIGFYCLNNTAASNIVITNFINNGTGVKNFILDYNPLTTEIFSSISLATERNEVLFTGDSGQHILIKFTVPQNVPIGSMAKLTSSTGLFGPVNSHCAIESSLDNQIFTTLQCSITGGVLTCPINSLRKEMIICCQNILVSNPSTLNLVEINFPLDPNIATLNNFVSSSIFSSLNASTSFNYIPNYGPAVTTIIPQLSNVSYSHVSQPGGLGKIIFSINLNRSLTSNMRISLSTDLSQLSITNLKTFCDIGFGNNSNLTSNLIDGSGYVDSCFSDLTNTTNPIIFHTKKIIIKCSIAVLSIINITIWPVNQVNFSTLTNPTQKLMNVKMTLLNGAIALGENTFNSQMNVNFQSNEIVSSKLVDFCNVSIFPKIPDEYSALLFKFDFSKATLSKETNFNEISIFFPRSVYGDLKYDKILCMNNNAILNCYFNENNLLVIYKPSLGNLSLTNFEIKVYNLLTPFFVSDIYFGCSVNVFNKDTKIRINLANGTGKFTAFSTINNLNILKLMNRYNYNGPASFSGTNANNLSDVNPRNISSHSFRISIDYSLGNLTPPFSISNKPYLVITFPLDYRFPETSSVDNNNSELKGLTNPNLDTINLKKISTSINENSTRSLKSEVLLEMWEYFKDPSNASKETKSTSQIPFNYYLEGNNFIIYFSKESYTFTNDFVYMDIIFHNIINPDQNSESNITKTTQEYKVFITNDNKEYLYKMYSNTNSFSNYSLPSQIDNFLNYSKGSLFKFDNKKWIIDVIDPNLSIILNRVSLLTGRYKLLNLKNKTNESVLMTPASATVKITNDNFKMNPEIAVVPSAYFYPIEFYIGCECSSVLGKYIIYFNSNTSDISAEPINTRLSANLYTSIPPLVVDLYFSRGTISYSSPDSVVIGGSSYIFYSASERAFNDVIIQWTAVGASTGNISIGAIKTFNNKGRSTFTISPLDIATQNFNLNSFNTDCFIPVKSTLTLKIEGISAIIPNNAITKNDFNYFNFNTNPSLNRNSIQFTYNSVYRPVLIHCSLLCINLEYPDDEKIIDESKILQDKYLSYNDSTILYYSDTVQSTLNDFPILFDNLLRSERYKLKCIITPTNSISNAGTRSIITIEDINTADGKTNQFIPTPPANTLCAEINFQSQPTDETKTILRNHCQYKYSLSGFPTNGCVICTDLYGLRAPGLEFPNTTTCSGSGYRFRASNVTESNSGFPKYNICAVASLNCNSDVRGVNDFAGVFNNYVNEINTAAKIQVNLNVSQVNVQDIKIYGDLEGPKLEERMGIRNTYFENNGYIRWTLLYPTPLQCYFQIDQRAKNNPPLFTEVQSCKKIFRCGFTLATAEGYFREIGISKSLNNTMNNSTNRTENSGDININTRLLKDLFENDKFLYKNQNRMLNTTNSTSNITNFPVDDSPTYLPGVYQIWMACYNDIPFPLKKSEVFSIHNFRVEQNNTCLDVNGNDCGVDPIPIFSKILEMKLILILILFVFVHF